MMIGNKIKEQLTKKGLTQAWLAKATGFTESTISHYANDQRKPTVAKLNKIAKALGVEMGDLVE